MENMDLGQLAGQLFQGFRLDTDMMIEAVSKGNIGGAISILIDSLLETIGRPASYLKEYLIVLVILGIGAAVLKQLGLFFQDSQVQKIGFWIVYLVLASQLLSLYYSGEMIAKECLGNLIHFGNIFHVRIT